MLGRRGVTLTLVGVEDDHGEAQLLGFGDVGQLGSVVQTVVDDQLSATESP